MSVLPGGAPGRSWPGLTFDVGLWLPVLGLAAAAGLLRCWLGAHSGASLHVDEAQYWDWSRNLQWGYHSKPPGIALLIAASSAWFGDGETGLRALTLACWPLTAVVLAALTADMARFALQASRAGFWAAAILLGSPLASLLGLVATTDAPLMLCWSLAMAALWSAVVRRQAMAWGVLALALAAGLLSKYTMLALWPGALLFIVLCGRRGDLQRFGLASVLAALLLLPHAMWNRAEGWPTLLHTAEITALSTAAPATSATSATSPLRALATGLGFVCGQAVLLAPFAAVLIPGWRRRPTAAPVGRFEIMSLLVCCSLPLVAAAAVLAFRSGAQLNWMAPAHLALAIGLALAISAASARLRRRAAMALAVQAVFMTALPQMPVWARAQGLDWPGQADLWSRMRGWPQAFDALSPALDAEPGLPVVLTSRSLAAQWAYHRRHRPREFAVWQIAGAPSHHYERRCPWRPGLAPADSVLVVTETATSAGLPEAFAAAGRAERIATTLRAGASADNAQLSLWRLQLWPPTVAAGQWRMCP